jgi:hypothetical protein
MARSTSSSVTPRLSIVSITIRSLCCAKAASSPGDKEVEVGTGAGDGVVGVVAVVHAVSSTSARLRAILVPRIAHSFLLLSHFSIFWSWAQSQ